MEKSSESVRIKAITRLLEKYSNKKVILKEDIGNLKSLPGMSKSVWAKEILQGTMGGGYGNNGRTGLKKITPNSEVQKVLELSIFDKKELLTLIRKHKYGNGMFVVYINSVDNTQPAIVIQDDGTESITSWFLEPKFEYQKKTVTYSDGTTGQTTDYDAPQIKVKDSVRGGHYGGRRGRYGVTYNNVPKRSTNLLSVFDEFYKQLSNTTDLEIVVYFVSEDTTVQKKRNDRYKSKPNNEKSGTSIEPYLARTKKIAASKLTKLLSMLPDGIKIKAEDELATSNEISYDTKNKIKQYFDSLIKKFDKLFSVMYSGTDGYSSDKKINSSEDTIKKLKSARAFINNL